MRKCYHVFSCAHQVRMPTILIFYEMLGDIIEKKYTNMYFTNGL